MAKNRRNDAYKGDHSKVSYPAKKGRPLKPNGKQVSKSQTQRIEASEKAEKLKRNAKLVAALALTSGESMDVGMARMALIVTLRLVDEAKLEIDGKSRTVKGLHQVLKRAAELTSSSYKRICDLFWSFIESAGESFDVTDNSKRGSGSDKVDRAKLYKIGEDQSIELVWGVGKQRAGCLYFRKRDLATTKQHLRVGWYGGTVGRRTFLPCNVWGCWQNALTEMQSWVDKDLKFTPLVGLSGTLGSGLMNVGSWTSSEESCLDIKDMGTDDDELFEEEERVGGAQVVQAAQEDIQVAAAHVGGGNDGAEPGDEAVHGVEVAVMADA